ncbi:MAG: hypothetical protein Q2484_14300, partial [Candidatus Sedimenticola sp. (ex Thyasira tokunagai)]
KVERIDARYWGGAVCSSDEASVMDVERRDSVKQPELMAQPHHEGLDSLLWQVLSFSDVRNHSARE